MQSRKWFWKMWTLSLLALLGLFASPALAGTCCCDEAAETGHAHSAKVVGSHHHEAEPSPIHATRCAVTNGDDCQHAQCEATPFFVPSEQNKTFFAAPLLVVSVRAFEISRPATQTAMAFSGFYARPLAPDRMFRSGLSPPALSRS